MKILTAKQVYEADKATIENQHITPLDLMERAAMRVFEWIHERLGTVQVPVHVFCGVGNNGGDGMVLARLLYEHGYLVNCYVVNYSDTRSKCFLINYDRFKELKHPWPVLLDEQSELPELPDDQLVIDCIFGIGLNRPLDGWVKKLIGHINQYQSTVLSVDVPSGLFMEAATPDLDAVIKAQHTLTFQAPKLALYLPETGPLCGTVSIIDIGLDAETLQHLQSNAFLMTEDRVKSLYRFRDLYAHKGTYGHALIVGGSYGTMGAATLSTKACLRSGAGKVTALIPECGYTIMQISVPEAMVLTSGTHTLEPNTLPFKPTVIGVGPGMSIGKTAVETLEHLFKNAEVPFVIDADALNILSEHRDLCTQLPPQSVLTPHLGELKRLIGDWSDDYDMLEKVIDFSTTYDVIMVIKNAFTITVYKEDTYVNSSGNPGMATAGSGDVLTGIITGLIAQGYTPVEAAQLGVYLHGDAGDNAVSKEAQESLIAGDLIHYLPNSYKWLQDSFIFWNEEKVKQ